ncbi:DUF5060 domain-containing protein [Nibricoccus sp. IMCC34717]|uniref:DUF5060 domain-containing protein n=1 Tax=Nibricoccus sp. IMCC34717 TaxID=3034021 RepID=UPI00384F910E
MRAPLAAFLFLTTAHLAAAEIERATLLTPTPELYSKIEYTIVATANFTDPYRSAQVQLDLEAASPSGRRVVVPGFYERGGTGKSAVWRVRFAPNETGVYRGTLKLRDASGTAVMPVEFTVAPSTRKGFLRADSPWGFRFDNGEPFRGIGMNICWEARTTDDNAFFGRLHENERFHYEYLLGELAQHGGNFYRTWMCAWNLPLEWKKVIDTDRYTSDSASLNRSAMARLDELVALNEQLGLYCMLTLDHAGSYIGGQWQINSYAKAQGGPCEKPLDFFTLPEAKAMYRDRVRYLVARWGWSPSIAAWEFFNEVDNASYGQPERIPDEVITTWHREMADYLKSIDPQRRLVTTSISHRDIAGMNAIPAMDFSQRHIYGHTDEMGSIIRDYVEREGKPYVIGEYAYEWDWTKNFNSIADKLDADFKRGLWKGLFSPTPILPLTWWWEFFDERRLTPYLSRVRAIQDEMLAAGGGRFAEVTAKWEGKGVTLLAVKCGNSTFVLASNRSASSESGAVSLPTEPAGAQTVRLYDPETGAWSTVKSGGALCPSFEIAAGADKIVVFQGKETR